MKTIDKINKLGEELSAFSFQLSVFLIINHKVHKVLTQSPQRMIRLRTTDYGQQSPNQHITKTDS